MGRRLAASALMTALCTACGPSLSPCAGQCPNVAGTFSLASNAVFGKCDFTPYLLEPSLTITQEANGNAVTQVIDPTLAFPVVLAGPILVPDSATDQLAAAFEVHAQANQGTDAPGSLLTLNVDLHAIFPNTDQISGTLFTTSVGPPPVTACTMSLAFVGHR